MQREERLSASLLKAGRHTMTATDQRYPGFYFGRVSGRVHAPASLCAAVGVCVCTCLESGEQSAAGPSVPPDVTLLTSGAGPAAEVGRPTALHLWVEENRSRIWDGGK